jgi:small conductance mechanosensitive channel
MNRIIATDDEVILNNEHKGTVREITLNTVKIFKGTNSVLTMSHSEIKTIEKIFEGYTPIYTSIVLSYREDPEKAEDILIKLTEKLNEKYKDYLTKDEEGNVKEPFVYKGIVTLNADYQGIKYSIKGLVHTRDAEEIQRKLDRELAICCHRNSLKTTEQNVFYKTRSENK